MSPQTSNTLALVTLQEESQVAFHTCHPATVFAAAVSIFPQHLVLFPASQTAAGCVLPCSMSRESERIPFKCIQKKPQSGGGVSKCWWVLCLHSKASLLQTVAFGSIASVGLKQFLQNKSSGKGNSNHQVIHLLSKPNNHCTNKEVVLTRE